MEILNRLRNAGVVPVVVLDRAEDAVPTAKALLAGGIDVMEITFRTAAAPEAIKAVAENCPDMLVGAGTVITLEQCKKAVEQGAKFIVSPGFDAEVVSWCVENGVAVTPGGVSGENVGEYFAQPYVHAVGGSWVCAKSDIAAGNFDKITKLCAEARAALPER